MKKILIFFLIVVSSFSLYSISYNSNILFQRLGEVSQDSTYILSVEEDKEILYFNGSLLKTRQIQNIDDKTYISIFDDKENLLSQNIYENSYLIQKTDDSGVTNYTYDNDHLIFATENKDDENLVTYYIRNASDDSLIAINRYSNLSLLGSSYLFENDKAFVNATDNLIINDDFYFDEENNIVIEKDFEKKVYSSSGLLLYTESENSKTNYEYQEGVLVKTITEEESNKTISYYENSKLVKQEIFKDDVLFQIVDYIDSKMIKTIYSNNKETARIYYKEDNIRVERVEYL